MHDNRLRMLREGRMLIVVSFLVAGLISVFCTVQRKRHVKAPFIDTLGEAIYRLIVDLLIILGGVFVLGFITAIALYPFLEIMLGSRAAAQVDGAVRVLIMACVVYRRETAWKRP